MLGHADAVLLRDLVADELRSRGHSVEVHDAHMFTLSPRVRVPLWDLATAIRLDSRDLWPELVIDALDAMDIPAPIRSGRHEPAPQPAVVEKARPQSVAPEPMERESVVVEETRAQPVVPRHELESPPPRVVGRHAALDDEEEDAAPHRPVALPARAKPDPGEVDMSAIVSVPVPAVWQGPRTLRAVPSPAPDQLDGIVVVDLEPRADGDLGSGSSEWCGDVQVTLSLVQGDHRHPMTVLELLRAGGRELCLAKARDTLVAQFEVADFRVDQQPSDERAFTRVRSAWEHTSALPLVMELAMARFAPDADLSNGVLFSIPDRGEMDFHVLEHPMGVAFALLSMPSHAAQAHARGMQPLSPHSFLWRNGEVTCVTHETDGVLGVDVEGYLEDFLSRPATSATPARQKVAGTAW